MPLTITCTAATATPEDAALVAVGVTPGDLAAQVPGVDAAVLAAAGFTGAANQTCVAATTDGPRLLVGLGDEPTIDDYRRFGATIAKATTKHASVAVDLIDDLDLADRAAAAQQLTLGLALASYGFNEYKAAPEDAVLAEATIVAKGGKRITDAVRRGTTLATAAALVRDLVNTPGGDLTPAEFADHAVTVAANADLEIEIWDRAKIEAEGFGGLAGVARGSAQEPRFVKLTHRPAGKPRGRIALVGKGVTFDSGGLSIKPAGSMEWMKTDMAGAATVLAVLSIVGEIAPKLEVTAYLPLTDNMLGGDATRVGDVLRARNGKTIEVLNTDAEGRLILADALALAAEDEPDAIIDLATLTGACMVALGDRTAGVMGNHDGLIERVLASAVEADEAMWPLPLPAHLRKGLDSEIADLRNIGAGPYGGASVAGLFLQEFVGDVPWVHLDIAGPSNTSAPWDEHTKGGTGFAVRTLADLLAGWSKLSA